tara:strand:+ start:211 stop:789 length:579 start_codon:yes stop_codon:yes gene_type:complete
MLNRAFLWIVSTSLLYANPSLCIDSLSYIYNIKLTLSNYDLPMPIYKKIQYESCNLVSIGGNLKLDSVAAEAFLKMKKDAKKDLIEFRVVSAFRSFNHQRNIINRKLKKGKSIESILKENTMPGYSEHHTGYAVDFLADGAYSLSVDFENTDTFRWLIKNANRYGFYLSYPKGNKKGIMYEPWHWTFNNNVN